MTPVRYAALLLFAVAATVRAEEPKDKPTCAVYSLAASDADFGKWVVETVPQVIDPETWGKAVITYNATKRVLVVRHTPAVQAKVAAFLKDLDKAGPAKGGEEAASVPVEKPAPPVQASDYPVPATKHKPKHLVHFIIRYEGDGFIDPNVVKFAKALTGVEVAKQLLEQKLKAESAERSPVGAAIGAVAGGLIGGAADRSPKLLPRLETRMKLPPLPELPLPPEPLRDEKK